jgi:hypothetical protein
VSKAIQGSGCREEAEHSAQRRPQQRNDSGKECQRRNGDEPDLARVHTNRSITLSPFLLLSAAPDGSRHVPMETQFSTRLDGGLTLFNPSTAAMFCAPAFYEPRIGWINLSGAGTKAWSATATLDPPHRRP